jgi:hypothetical protein
MGGEGLVMKPSTKTLRISGTDVIMYDYEAGKGKIIISNDDFDYNLSYYWGSMGESYDLSKFIRKISTGYFVNKLGLRGDVGEINIKKTMVNVRKFIKNDADWKWYYDIDADKELRKELNIIQKYTSSTDEFIHRMMTLDIVYPTFQGDVKIEFEALVEQLRSEPWFFIVKDEPPVNVWLKFFHPILVSHLEKELTHEH